jgi:hypothetical protein
MARDVSAKKRSKYEQLSAVFERFHEELGKLPDERAAQLCASWEKGKRWYADLLASRQATRSQLAAGLEQGLRETPQILESMPPLYRQVALKALASALEAEYPAFLEQDQVRLAKIRARGSIRDESEYYLVRNRIDLLEGSGEEAELVELYCLVDKFEAK